VHSSSPVLLQQRPSAPHLWRLQTGRTPTAPRPIRTGDGTFPRATRTTGPAVTETTTASPASRNAESVDATSPFHAAAQTCARAVCAAALVAIGACFGATPTATADSVPVTATVLKVVDGDTIDIRNDDRGRLRVRLLGIDTPETKKPGYTVGCWGPEATEFAKSTMVEQRVAVVTDPLKTGPTDMAAPWHTLSGPTASIIRSRPFARVRRSRMYTEDAQ